MGGSCTWSSQRALLPALRCGQSSSEWRRSERPWGSTGESALMICADAWAMWQTVPGSSRINRRESRDDRGHHALTRETHWGSPLDLRMGLTLWGRSLMRRVNPVVGARQATRERPGSDATESRHQAGDMCRSQIIDLSVRTPCGARKVPGHRAPMDGRPIECTRSHSWPPFSRQSWTVLRNSSTDSDCHRRCWLRVWLRHGRPLVARSSASAAAALAIA